MNIQYLPLSFNDNEANINVYEKYEIKAIDNKNFRIYHVDISTNPPTKTPLITCQSQQEALNACREFHLIKEVNTIINKLSQRISNLEIKINNSSLNNMFI